MAHGRRDLLFIAGERDGSRLQVHLQVEGLPCPVPVAVARKDERAHWCVEIVSGKHGHDSFWMCRETFLGAVTGVVVPATDCFLNVSDRGGEGFQPACRSAG